MSFNTDACAICLEYLNKSRDHQYNFNFSELKMIFICGNLLCAQVFSLLSLGITHLLSFVFIAVDQRWAAKSSHECTMMHSQPAVRKPRL